MFIHKNGLQYTRTSKTTTSFAYATGVVRSYTDGDGLYPVFVDASTCVKRVYLLKIITYLSILY